MFSDLLLYVLSTNRKLVVRYTESQAKKRDMVIVLR